MSRLDKQDEEDAWNQYEQDKSTAARNRLIELYLPMVQRLAAAIRLPQWAGLETSDLVSAGVTGLVTAIEAFDREKGVRFSTFGQLRIRGAIIDHMRQFDWVPRLERSRERRGTVVPKSMTALSVLARRRGEDEGDRSIEILDRSATSPEATTEVDSFWQSMCRQFKARDRLILLMIYREGMTFRQVGEQLDISESRISQIHAGMLQTLRDRMVPERNEMTPQTQSLTREHPEKPSVAQFFASLKPETVAEWIAYHEAELTACRKLLAVLQPDADQAPKPVKRGRKRQAA